MDFFKKVLKISLIVVLAVIIIYLIVGLFFLSDNKSSGKYQNFGNVVAPGSSSIKGSTNSTDKLDVNLDKILINLRSGQYQYMKADMTFHMSDDSQKELLLQNMPRVRDTILRFSAMQDSDKLATPAGKEEYKKKVQDLLYNEYGYKIDAVYFRNFVLAP